MDDEAATDDQHDLSVLGVHVYIPAAKMDAVSVTYWPSAKLLAV